MSALREMAPRGETPRSSAAELHVEACAGGFAQVPWSWIDLWAERGIPAVAQLALLHIFRETINRRQRKGAAPVVCADISLAAFGVATNIEPDSVRRILDGLAENGWIVRTRKGHVVFYALAVPRWADALAYESRTAPARKPAVRAESTPPADPEPNPQTLVIRPGRQVPVTLGAAVRGVRWSSDAPVDITCDVVAGWLNVLVQQKKANAPEIRGPRCKQTITENSDAFKRVFTRAWEAHKKHYNREPLQLVTQLLLERYAAGELDLQKFDERHTAYVAYWEAAGWQFSGLTLLGWVNAGMPEPPPPPLGAEDLKRIARRAPRIEEEKEHTPWRWGE